MNAAEIRNLNKKFGDKRALDGLDMTVPQGAIYGFIGENGSGKSTTEKLICGLLKPDGGEIRLFGKRYNDRAARPRLGVLIESPGCFASYSVLKNMKLQAANLGLRGGDEKIKSALRLVRMEGAATNKYKNCSLGMKQRVGIAMALLGDPELLVLDEPMNGLDADGMRILREILLNVAARGCTVIISSHLLGELEKIATHYGIIRRGKMIKEMTSGQFSAECPEYVALKAEDMGVARRALEERFPRVGEEGGYLRVYGGKAEDVSGYLYNGKGVAVTEIFTAKIGLEEYYKELMKGDSV